MKTIFYNFSRGVDAVTDRRMMEDGFAVVMDNVDIRSGYPVPFRAPALYQQTDIGITRIWEFRNKWYTSALYRTYAAEALPTQERIYFAEEGDGHVVSQKIVNDVQAPLGSLVPDAAPILTSAQNTVPRNLTLTSSTSGNLPKNIQYSYRVSAVTALGILQPCQPVTTTLSTEGGVTLTWGAVPGAIGYAIFGRTPGNEQIIAQTGVQTSYFDNGSITPSGPFASTYDVTAPFTYVYTYVRTVGGMEDESGPSPLTVINNSGQGRTIQRQPVYDGFLAGATSLTTGVTTTASPYSVTLTGLATSGNNTILTVQTVPFGPWYSGDGLRVIDSTGKDYSPNSQNMAFSFPTALATPAAPTTGTPVAGSGLSAGTYIWKVAAIRGATSVSAGDPAITAASAASGSVTIGSASTVPISWTPVIDANGYRLYRSGDGGSTWDQVVTLPQSLSTYDDDGTNKATGVTPPSTDSTATRSLVLVNIDLSSAIATPVASGISVILGKTIVNVSPANVFADGDAVFFTGCSQSDLNRTQYCELYKATAASSTNVNVGNPGTSTFDSYAVSNGDIVLLVGQSTASENGPWTFNGSSSAMTRPIFYTTGDTFTAAQFGSVYIVSGTVYGDTLLKSTTGGTITIGTTDTAWSATTTTTAFLIEQYSAADDAPTQIQWTTGNNFYTSWRIYRSGDAPSFLRVADLPITQDTYTDVVPVTALGVALPSSYTQDGIVVTYAPPPASLQYLELFNGMLFGVDGNTVRWTPTGVPDAWPDSLTVTMAYPPTGLASFASGLIILCPDAIYRLDGFTPTTLSLQKTYCEDGCIAPHSIQKSSRGLLYLAKRGVMLFDGTVGNCLTEARLPYKFLTQPSVYTDPWTEQNFWWFTTDHTAAYAQLSWGSNSPIYFGNQISYTVVSDTPQDGIINAVRSFVFRNKYFLFYSSAANDFDANTMVSVDLGVPSFPITTLGAKLVDAHVSSLDEAYVLVNNCSDAVLSFFYADGTTPLDDVNQGNPDTIPFPDYLDSNRDGSAISPGDTLIVGKATNAVAWSIPATTVQGYSRTAPYDALGSPVLTTDLLAVDSGILSSCNIKAAPNWPTFLGSDIYYDITVMGGGTSTIIRVLLKGF